VQTYNGARLSFLLSEELAQALKSLSHHEGATLFMTLLAAFGALLYRYSKQVDILIGTDIANRVQINLEGLIGFFVNQLALRLDFSGDPTFRQLLARTRAVTLGAYAHQDLPFDKLVDEVRAERDPSRPPIFQVKLALQNAPFESLELPGLSLNPFELEATRSQLQLALFLRETSEGIAGMMEYNTDLFNHMTVKRMLAHFELLLARATDQPDVCLSELAGFIDTVERERLEAEREELAAASLRKFRSIKPKVVYQMSIEEAVRWERLEAGGPPPLVAEPLVPELDLVELARANRDFIEKRVLRHGAILFRNFRVRPQADFQRFTQAVCDDLFTENGEHPRQSLGGYVYTPVFYPADRLLLWRNENSFNHRWPLRIWFCCTRPAESGGATPIVDSREVFARLDPRIKERFMARGVMYVRNYGVGLGHWHEVFQTDDRAEVERRCREAGMELEWKEGDGARTRCVRPAVVRHPRTGELSWFNQAQRWHVSCLDPQTRESIAAAFREEDYPRNCYYGDGSPIEDLVMQEILEVYRGAQVVFPWQAGDILMLDNVLTAHARELFTGERKLLVAMGEMCSYDDVESPRA